MMGPGMEARATSENIGGRDPIRKDLDVPEGGQGYEPALS
jgi:hypothetical protein